MSKEVVIEHDGALKRIVWEFCLLDGQRMILDNYFTQTRPTLRHKWKSVDVWCRLMRRVSTVERPQVSVDVRDQALALFRSRIYYASGEGI